MRTVFCLALAGGLLASSAHAEPEKVTGANYALAAKFNRDFIRQNVQDFIRTGQGQGPGQAQDPGLVPQWIGKTDQFWYGVRTTHGVRYWRVDPTRKMKDPLFDVGTLSAQLSEAAQKPVDTDTL